MQIGIWCQEFRIWEKYKILWFSSTFGVSHESSCYWRSLLMNVPQELLGVGSTVRWIKTKSYGNCATIISNFHLLLESDIKCSQPLGFILMTNWGTLCQCGASPGWVSGGLCGPSLCLMKLGGVPGICMGSRAGIQTQHFSLSTAALQMRAARTLQNSI